LIHQAASIGGLSTSSQKEKRISLGVYPEVSLADARELRDEKRKLVAKGIDPSAKRKAEKSSLKG
jgi:hypothetical protein